MRSFFLQDLPGGQDKAVIGLIYVDNLDFDVLQEIRFKIFDIGKGKLGCRDESSQAFYHGDDAAIYNTLYLNRKNGFLFHVFCNTVPRIGVVDMVFIISHRFNNFVFL